MGTGGVRVIEQLLEVIGRVGVLVGLRCRVLSMGVQSIVVLLGHVVNELVVVLRTKMRLQRLLVLGLEVALSEVGIFVDGVGQQSMGVRLVGQPWRIFSQRHLVQHLLDLLGRAQELVGLGNSHRRFPRRGSRGPSSRLP